MDKIKIRRGIASKTIGINEIYDVNGKKGNMLTLLLNKGWRVDQKSTTGEQWDELAKMGISDPMAKTKEKIGKGSKKESKPVGVKAAEEKAAAEQKEAEEKAAKEKAEQEAAELKAAEEKAAAEAANTKQTAKKSKTTPAKKTGNK